MMDNPIRKRLVLAIVILAAVVGGVVLLAFGCHASLLTVKWPDGVQIPGTSPSIPPTSPTIDMTIGALVVSAGAAYPVLIRPIRLWWAGRKDAKP